MEVEFMTTDTTLPPCMPLPRAMLRLPISSTAKVMYARMLDIVCRYCVTASFLCSPNSARVYSPATGRRNCCCETARCEVWPETESETT